MTTFLVDVRSAVHAYSFLLYFSQPFSRSSNFNIAWRVFRLGLRNEAFVTPLPWVSLRRTKSNTFMRVTCAASGTQCVCVFLCCVVYLISVIEHFVPKNLVFSFQMTSIPTVTTKIKSKTFCRPCSTATNTYHALGRFFSIVTIAAPSFLSSSSANTRRAHLPKNRIAYQFTVFRADIFSSLFFFRYSSFW